MNVCAYIVIVNVSDLRGGPLTLFRSLSLYLGAMV